MPFGYRSVYWLPVRMLIERGRDRMVRHAEP
jgi:hypothetical protein